MVCAVIVRGLEKGNYPEIPNRQAQLRERLTFVRKDTGPEHEYMP